MSRLSRPAASRRVNVGAAIPEQPLVEKSLRHLGLEP